MQTSPKPYNSFGRVRQWVVAILRRPAKEALLGRGLQVHIMLVVVETGPDRLP